MNRAAGLALGLLLAPTALRAAQLLPALTAHLEAAHYMPAERDFQWSGWIGAGVELLRAGDTAAYFDGAAETLLGDERRPFEANQVNYHLEVGVRHRVGSVDLAGRFFHVSRHAVDREKPEAVDWNMLGLRASLPFPASWPVPGRAWLSAGRATLASRVGYSWELTAALEAHVLVREWGRAYLRAGARALTVDATSELDRDGFVDGIVEAGLRFPRAACDLDVYAAFERRNDVFLLVPGGRSRGLAGIRFARGDRPPFR